MSWFGNNSTRPITFEQSAAYNAAKGAAGEQPAEPPPCFTCDGLGCPDCEDVEEYDRDRLDDR